MADVNVEFGAKDTGLEATLKTVQEQMTNLENEVKSGTLSFEDLAKKMREIRQAEGIFTKLGGEVTEATKSAKELGKDVADAGNKSDKMGDQAGIGFGKLASAIGVGQLAAQAFTAALDAGFAAVRNTIQGFTDALDLGGKLSELSSATGESAGNLLILQRAFDNTGAGADQVGPVLAKLQNNIFGAGEGSKEAAAAFSRMGISLDELAGKTPTEQLAIVASGITSIEDPAARAATAIDIFGKSGAELLPILTNFSGEINNARDTVGSLADIMDRRANVFDAVGDRFLIIQQKVRDFAAGILDRALPALDAITGGLSRIDAAGLGQKLADAFLGGTGAMAGFQRAVDAFSAGNISDALSILWDSVVLQAQMTANSIYKNLSAAFATAGDVLGQIFSSDGPAFMTIISGFDYLSGYIKSTIAGSLADTFAGLGPAFTNISEGLRIAADAGAASAELALQRIPIAAGLAAEDIAAKLGAAPEIFRQNLINAGDVIPGLTEKAALLAGATEQSSDKAADFAANLGEGRRQMEDLVEAQKRSYNEEVEKAKAVAQTSVKAQKAIQLEIDLNNAKAAGNKELVKELQSRKNFIADQEKINKLTEEYKKTMPDKVARQMAEEMVRSERAAGNTKEDLKQVKTFVDLIANTNPSKGVEKLSEKTAKARQEITAFGNYIGVDLSRMSLPDIAKKLGVDTMGMDGSEQIDAIIKHIQKELPKAKQGVVDEKASTDSVAATAKKAGEELKSALDYVIETEKGGEVLLKIEGLVDAIKGYVETIRDRLPQTALAY